MNRNNFFVRPHLFLLNVKNCNVLSVNQKVNYYINFAFQVTRDIARRQLCRTERRF